MKKQITKYLLLSLLIISLGSVLIFFSAHIILHIVWLYSQGVVHSIVKLLAVRWLSIPVFGLFFTFISFFHFISASPKEKANKKFFIMKSVLIFILASTAEYFLHISYSLLEVILGGFSGIIDPLTKLDMSLYLFWLPLIKKSSIFMIFYVAVLLGFRYTYPVKQKINILDKGLFILGVHSALILAVIARFEHIYDKGELYIGYVDIYGNFIPYTLFLAWVFIAVFIAVFFLKFRSKATALGLLMTALLFLGTQFLWPLYLDRMIYNPNQSSLQEKFAGIHADSTRRTFMLDTMIRDNSFMIKEEDIPTIVRKNFWQDAAHFVQVVKRNQEILPIFEINDASPILIKNEEDSYDPYFIATRESTENTNDLWDIKHLRNIFGYGAVIGSASSFDAEGYSELILKDLELNTSNTNTELKNPHIFFSDSYDDYAFINTSMLMPNFKKEGFPLEKQEFTKVNGISINFFIRILLMIVHRDTRFLLTDYFNKDTQILLNRKPSDILKVILPQFHYSNPRPVLHNKELWWEIDVYSVSTSVKSAKSVKTPWGDFNWVRSPIKAYVSAYSGEIILDIIDNNDPHVRIVTTLFPRLFEKKINLSPEKYLYPIDLFDVQSQLLALYHDLNATSFYSGFNKREIAKNLDGKEEPIKNRVLLEKNKIAFQRTFTPQEKNIFSAQLLAYIDDNKKQTLHLYEAPARLGIAGLAQAESFLNQDPEFSRISTLWGQMGSKISSSETLFYPLKNNGVYLRTIFLESETISTPLAAQFTLIDNRTISLGDTIEGLLNNVLNHLSQDGKIPPTQEEQLRKALIEAYQYYLNAEKARIDGNTQEYQENVDKIGVVLQGIAPAGKI